MGAVRQCRNAECDSAFREVAKLVRIIFINVIRQVASAVDTKREVMSDAVTAGADAADIIELCHEELLNHYYHCLIIR